MKHELLLSKRQLTVMQAYNEGNEEHLRAMLGQERKQLYDELANTASRLQQTENQLHTAEAQLQAMKDGCQVSVSSTLRHVTHLPSLQTYSRAPSEPTHSLPVCAAPSRHPFSALC